MTGPRRIALLGFVFLLGARAPLQCTGEPDPALAMEESPGEALYLLAEEFRERGARDAWLDTLRFIVARYPKSRFAVTAADDLAREGIDAGVP